MSSDPFAGFDLLTPSRQSSQNFGTTPAGFQPQQPVKQPSANLNQTIMSQFQTSSTIQTQNNGPARTQFMAPPQSVLQPTQMSPFATVSASNNPFAEPAPAYPYAMTTNRQPSMSTTNNPFGDPFGTQAIPPPPPAAAFSSATVQDFDPFSPKGSTPRMPLDFGTTSSSSSSISRQPSMTRQTQEASRRNLDVAAFATGSQRRHSVKDILEAEKMSISDDPGKRQDDNGFMTSSTSDVFAAAGFSNLDDDFNPRGAGSRRNSMDSDGPLQKMPSRDLSEDMEDDEYEVIFDYGSKLGVLMERVDTYVKDNKQDRKRELAVVKLVVEGGAADRIGVKVGSIIRGINHKDMEYETYNTVLELIKTAPRPMTIRLKERGDAKETTQGSVLTRISSGTFSVGNLTAGNAKWDSKYFAFGGAKMDVLQLFVSRAAYHECVIALYEKRQVSTQIQSFRLYRDHKLSPIKSKIYKGYGNLHYFSLTVPSLRFVAAKFASENYDTIKNMWQLAFEAIEKKKRQAY
ncbi:hypothetical protein AeMF1_012072 [Aphanomyces euteiches]|nr:hypothetical protein AeMF1_012072 [Aphanomyces euteiches]KAH9188193.1 hypothetical protein AeNC1_009830 [Aphanomyces euteiches]